MSTATPETFRLEALVKSASHGLKSFPQLANGLTLDSVRNSEAYKTAKRDYQIAFNALRMHNAQRQKY